MNTHHIQFFTATMYKWTPVLLNDDFKDIIIESLSFLSDQKRCIVYGFVIMPNHIHIIWKIDDQQSLAAVQRDFLKFTAQQIRFKLIEKKSALISRFEVNLRDRKYQFWQRNSLSIDLWNREVVEQKLDYIHANPVSGKWNLAEDFVQYRYSSASFYEDDQTEFKFLRHYMECFNG